MSIIRNAWAYVARSKSRTIIIFLILTVILSSLYSCINILKSADEIKNSLYTASNTSFSIVKKEENGYFAKNDVKGLDKITEITRIEPQYDGVGHLTKETAVGSENQVMREDIPDNMRDMVSIQFMQNSSRDILFKSGVFKIKKGNGISEADREKIVVHEDFARQNNLKLGDKIRLKLDSTSESKEGALTKEFTISGIFAGKKHEKYTGLSSDLTENMMFADFGSVQRAFGMDKGHEIVSKLNIFTASPEDTKTAIEKMEREILDKNKFLIDREKNQTDEILEAASAIKEIVKIMTSSIFAGGIIALTLILILWIRDRVYEIGILISIGVNKAKIMTQFILELIITSIFAIPFGFLLGNLIRKLIMGGLNNADSSSQIEQGIEYIDLYRNGISSFLEAYAVLAIIVVISVAISSGMILIKKPKEIFTKIS